MATLWRCEENTHLKVTVRCKAEHCIESFKQTEGTVAGKWVDRELQCIEIYSEPLKQVPLWNSITVSTETRGVHLQREQQWFIFACLKDSFSLRGPHAACLRLICLTTRWTQDHNTPVCPREKSLTPQCHRIRWLTDIFSAATMARCKKATWANRTPVVRPLWDTKYVARHSSNVPFLPKNKHAA